MQTNQGIEYCAPSPNQGHYMAFLNQHLGQTDELDYYIQDAAKHHVFVIPPDKSKSGLFEVIE